MIQHSRLGRGFAETSGFILMSLATTPALAAGSNMPWEQPLNQILQSVQGPVAKVISVIIIVITGRSGPGRNMTSISRRRRSSLRAPRAPR